MKKFILLFIAVVLSVSCSKEEPEELFYSLTIVSRCPGTDFKEYCVSKSTYENSKLSMEQAAGPCVPVSFKDNNLQNINGYLSSLGKSSSNPCE